jgi:hypothetical protein
VIMDNALVDEPSQASPSGQTYEAYRSSRHEYLSGLADAQCQSILAAGELMDLPVMHIDRVLFPGQKLPLLLRTEGGHRTLQWRHRCCVATM